jgi:methylase of polypeptide subunit release factors
MTQDTLDFDVAAAAAPAHCEVVDDDAPQFFAPAPTGALDSLFGRYEAARLRIVRLAETMEGELGGVFSYFVDGNTDKDRRHSISATVKELFAPAGAMAALNAYFWQEAISLTDVLNHMPKARRDEWHEAIRTHATPAFERESVLSTIAELLHSRERFFAERVDGIFQGLSREHVTNRPEGFFKRMILTNVLNEWGSYGGRCGLINDLRVVIARFMGRDEPPHYATNKIVENAQKRQPGKWLTLDGGALRLRVYLNGNGHLEVHPDMAVRLNQVLAYLHPAAIPSEFRTKPKKPHKEFVMMGRPLPFAVLGLLEASEPVHERTNPGGYPERWHRLHNTRVLKYYPHGTSTDKHVRQQARAVLQAIGGTQRGKDPDAFEFDYCPADVLAEIVSSGCIPDQQAHQFYPTPEALAQQAVEMAQIGEGHTVLEPSAGHGGIAEHLPRERLTCVEISPLHCTILKAKGFTEVHEADFLQWAEAMRQQGRTFDRIVMNPPFSQGRAQAHIEAASQLLAPKGRLVAVLPAGMRGKDVLPGLQHEWSRQHDNAFAGTSVSVALLAAQRAA